MPTPRRSVIALVVGGLIALGAVAGATRAAHPQATATAPVPASAAQASPDRGASASSTASPIEDDRGEAGFDDE